jgi:RecA-family ATPase
MIFAPRGVGKSYFALALAKAISAGSDIFAWKCREPVKVAYFDGEMSASDLQRRLHNLKNPNGLEPETGFLQILTPDFHRGIMPDISDTDDHGSIIETLEDSKVVIFDNLSCFARSVSRENESDSWTNVQSLLLQLKRKGKAVLFIHHSGKNNEQRGTSKKEDILDVVIKLSRPEGYEATEGARCIVEFKKNRHFYGEDAATFEIRLERMENEDLVWNHSKVISENQKITEMLQAGMNKKQIAEKLGIHASTVGRKLEKK